MAHTALLEKVQRIVLLMHADILSLSKLEVGEQIGVYNRVFVQKWAPLFSYHFGQDGERVTRMNLTALNQALQAIHKKMSGAQLFHGNE